MVAVVAQVLLGVVLLAVQEQLVKVLPGPTADLVLVAQATEAVAVVAQDWLAHLQEQQVLMQTAEVMAYRILSVGCQHTTPVAEVVEA